MAGRGPELQQKLAASHLLFGASGCSPASVHGPTEYPRPQNLRIRASRDSSLKLATAREFTPRDSEDATEQAVQALPAHGRLSPGEGTQRGRRQPGLPRTDWCQGRQGLQQAEQPQASIPDRPKRASTLLSSQARAYPVSVPCWALGAASTSDRDVDLEACHLMGQG